MIDLINQIIDELCQIIHKLYKDYNKRMIYLTKNNTKKSKYKIYFDFIEYLGSKYKTKNFVLDSKSLINYYSQIISKKSKTSRKSDFINNLAMKDHNFYSSSKKVCIADDSMIKRELFIGNKQNNDMRLSLPKNEKKERKKSISFFSLKKENFYKAFTETDSQLTQSESNSINTNDTQTINIKEINNQNNINVTKKLFDKVESLETPNNLKEFDSENYLKTKLNEINIPWIHYKKIFKLSNSDIMRQLFNPKKFYIWNKFILILKDFIFSSKKFYYVSKLFKMKFRLYPLIKSTEHENREFSLKYPIKVKNFICDDYYRPFTKPNLNFFNNKLLKVSHRYLNEQFLKFNKFEIDKISKILFPRLLSMDFDRSKKMNVECELINSSGSYFGKLYINHYFLLFVSHIDEDKRKKGNNNKIETEEDYEREEFYLYSYSLEERVKDKNKYIIIYFNEIKEVLVRRVCLNYIAYEFFMKNNESYFFNFFNKKNFETFLYLIIQSTKFRNNKNDSNHFNTDHVRAPIIYINIDENKFPVIKNLTEYFEKNEFRIKHYKGEISNFKYLLLLNKFSSRSYNDLLQYSVFPLLYLDIGKTIERDLSKVLALNKPSEQLENVISRVKINYEAFGYHFNSHYSTSGFVLYYLVRLEPFTTGQIKLQSGQFDAPKRMFSTYENYLLAIESSEENRELIPEFFTNYEIFLNLNYINLGYMKEDNLVINDLKTKEENGIAEFIINMRKKLEEVNILPWVDNVFGFYQDFYDEKEEVFNLFAASSYEQFNDFEKMKKQKDKNRYEIRSTIKEIKDKLSLLSLGITPIKLLKTPSKRRTMSKTFNSSRINSKSFINNKKNNESNYYKDIYNFIIQNFDLNDSQIFLIEDENNYVKKIAIKTNKNLHILNINNENRTNIKLQLRNKKIIQLNPSSKLFCELSPGTFLFCRYMDKALHFITEKSSHLLKYKHTITSLEFFSYTCEDNIYHKNKVLFGDEVGNINLLLIEYEINNKKQIDFNRIKITKIARVHNSYIQGIMYIKRLNIIISYSEEGLIAINNAFSFNFINFINVGNNFYINEIKISKYDLIYVYCTDKENGYDYIKCYSLNGLKFTELRTQKKIINFFVYESLIVVYENNLIDIFNLYDIDGEPIKVIEPGFNKGEEYKKSKIDDTKKTNKNKLIIFCSMNETDKKLFLFYDKEHFEVEDISIQLLK